MARVAVVIEDQDWHLRALQRAFAALGAELIALRLPECELDTTARSGVRLPGFGDTLPDAVLVRAVGGGSFEAVTRRLGVLHALGTQGTTVWNDVRAIERCVDKSMTSFLLAHAGLPTPPAWTVEGLPAAREVVAREAAQERLVLKPLFGSQGKGLALIAGPDDLPEPSAIGDIYHLQRFVPAHGRGYEDHRLFVCGGEVIAAMTRTSPRWITNIRRGGQPRALEPDHALCDLALRAAACVGAAYAGVDIIRDPEGNPLILEVNSMPGWRGLQKVTPEKIAERLAARLLAAI